MTAPDRRSVIAGAASAAAFSPLLIPSARAADWSPGVVRHIAPTASASAFRIKDFALPSDRKCSPAGRWRSGQSRAQRR
jgi:hypothetical protein